MNTKTAPSASDCVEFMDSIGLKDISLGRSPHGFSASTYWPGGDVLMDKGCHGHGPTLEGAIDAMLKKVEIAKTEKIKLTTAAQCKAAVQALIREHDAAPDDFVAAVDALLVK